MTVFANSNAGYLTAKQVFPVDYEAEVSQRLVDAVHANDVKTALECIADPFVDVNFVGTVSFKFKKTEIVLRGELAHELRVDSDEFRTDVTALFLAAHSGNFELVRKLLDVGGNVNEKLFRGYATTAAAREGHARILEALIRCGASQAACEEALLEATYLGRASLVRTLMASEMIRPHVATHALVSASCRGFADVVHNLIKSGVDANASDRLLLQSSKPSLYASVNCYALVAAVVSRQINVVKLLLQAGVRTDMKVNLGAWWWDPDSGEDFRVGAGLAEAYDVAWCAVEYFEASGAILRMLLEKISPNIPHFGRNLIHHAILCGNAKAVDVLINCGADVEASAKTTTLKEDFRGIHLAARLGSATILGRLISADCNVNSLTRFGETALMICARQKFGEGLRILASAGADFGLANSSGQSASSIAESVKWRLELQRIVSLLILNGIAVRSSNKAVFSPLLFVARANDVVALKMLIETGQDLDIDEQDGDGFSAAMVAAKLGNVVAFELLLNAGADLTVRNKFGDTALKLSEQKANSDEFEKLMLKHALEARHSSVSSFFALSRAAKRGDLGYVRALAMTKGCDVNAVDEDGNTPLMAAAREGHREVCGLLITLGARCEAENAKGETALSLSRGSGAEGVIMDELARRLVGRGARVAKHTRRGRGAPHGKVLSMVGGGVGVLSWGKSGKRNVVCKAAEVGPSDTFRRNRRRKLDADVPGIFRVVTTKNKEVHFVCEGGVEMAELWVRGIRLVTNEAMFWEK